MALDLHRRTGDWLKVVEYVRDNVGSDEMLIQAWNSLADEYAERGR